MVKLVSASIPYGFEYLGNHITIVCTPLTDRIMVSMVNAKYMGYFGAVTGPAGAGKSFIIMDLARAIGVKSYERHCSDVMD